MAHLTVNFHRSISFASYGRLKSEVVRDIIKKTCVFWKNDPLREDLENFVPKGFATSQTHMLCANFVKFGRPEIGKDVRYLPDKKKQKIGSRSRSRFCADRAQNLLGPATYNILAVPQISSTSVHFRRSYRRTRERRSNAPQSVCNTRRIFSFFTLLHWR